MRAVLCASLVAALLLSDQPPALAHSGAPECVPAGATFCKCESGREPASPWSTEDEVAPPPIVRLQRSTLRLRPMRRFALGVGGSVLVSDQRGSGNGVISASLRYRLSRSFSLGFFVDHLWRANLKERWSVSGLVLYHLGRIGILRPYLSAGVGMEFGDRYLDVEDRHAAVWHVGGGVEIPFGSWAVVLDLRARFLNGETSFLSGAGLLLRF